jgi:leucyl-tRNA synthetase
LPKTKRERITLIERNKKAKKKRRMSSAAEVAVASMSLSDGGGRGTAKRDALRASELEVQAAWADQRAFEADADPTKESFIVTFPYPYSNGHLHIGHAFSMSKAVFRAQYERHCGKNVLFPFAFHCTGMPIQAVRS